MPVDPGFGTVGSWVVGTLAAVLGLVLLAAALVAITYAVRGTPVRHVRALDDRLPDRDAAGHHPARATTRWPAGQRGGHEHGLARAGQWVEQWVDGMSPLAASSEEFCQLAKVLCKTALAEGHDVRYFFEGDALFDALLDDVARAERLVTWHVFWFKPGRIATRVADVLAERASAGVPVLLLLDHFGSKGLGDGYVRRLRDAGVEVAIFRPPRWNTLYKAQHRMHVRAVVVDGRVGYTGGFGVDDRWLGDGRHADQWRDTSARVEGAAVDQLQGAFVSNWAEATGELLLGNRVFDFERHEGRDGSHTAGLLYSSPSLGSTSAERFLFTAIAAARERCWLTSAYFVPNRHFRRLLREAAKRGVDVRVLTPGANTDRTSTWYAARAHYEELIDGGVRLYEYRPTMVHAKTLVIDGVWAMVGTLNFDNRSMVLNDEVGLLSWDAALGRELEAAFLADLEFADEITVARERARTGTADRLREWAACRVARLL